MSEERGSSGERGRWSSRRKTEVVLRALRGEDLGALSRELGVTAGTLAQWREHFLASGQAGLESRLSDRSSTGAVAQEWRGIGMLRLERRAPNLPYAVGAVLPERRVEWDPWRLSSAVRPPHPNRSAPSGGPPSASPSRQEPTDHWMTWVVSASPDWGIASARDRATCRLTTSSRTSICSTGRSAGRAPPRILAIRCAPARPVAAWSGP